MEYRVTSNISDLEAHLNKVFKGMLKSQELMNAGKEAGQAVGRYVGDAVNGSNDAGYNYFQSGQFHELIQDEIKDVYAKGTQNLLQIGMFDLDNMNNSWIGSKRNAQYQIHRIWDKETHEFINKSIYLKQENQLPKWVLAEFGSGHGGAVPSQFSIEYSSRPDKDIMFGPSLGRVGGAGGGEKKGFFMVSEKGLDGLLGPWARYNEHRMHGGMRAGHVFSGGLDKAKDEIKEVLAEGIQSYLDAN